MHIKIAHSCPATFASGHGVTADMAYPTSREFLLLWIYQTSHNPVFKVRNLRVHAISPGPVETPVLEQFRSGLGDP